MLLFKAGPLRFRFDKAKPKMGEEGKVIDCHSLQSWEEQIKKANLSNTMVVVDFMAKWCGPCRLIAPYFAELAKKLPNFTFLKVDIDELESVAVEYNIEKLPTFVLVKEGKILDRMVGMNRDKLQKMMDLHVASSSA